MQSNKKTASGNGYHNDTTAIKQLYEDWKPYWENGDAEKVVSFYTDDAVQIPIGEPDIVGKEAARLSLEAFFKEFTIKGDSTEIQEVKITDDFAFARGTYKLTLTPKLKGKPTQYTGKFLHIFKRRQDNSWKIYRAIGGDD